MGRVVCSVVNKVGSGKNMGPAPAHQFVNCCGCARIMSTSSHLPHSSPRWCAARKKGSCGCNAMVPNSAARRGWPSWIVGCAAQDARSAYRAVCAPWSSCHDSGVCVRWTAHADPSANRNAGCWRENSIYSTVRYVGKLGRPRHVETKWEVDEMNAQRMHNAVNTACLLQLYCTIVLYTVRQYLLYHTGLSYFSESCRHNSSTVPSFCQRSGEDRRWWPQYSTYSTVLCHALQLCLPPDNQHLCKGDLHKAQFLY